MAEPTDHAASITLDASQWRYISEGKLNLVWTFDSNHIDSLTSTNSSMIGRVMKVNKEILRRCDDTNMTTDGLAHRLHFGQRYIQHVMKPLFERTNGNNDHATTGDIFDSGRIVFVRPTLILQLLERDRRRRPLARLKQFDSFTCTNEQIRLPVLLFEDYTSPLHLHLRRGLAPTSSSPPPTICLELKPKWGFLPQRRSPDLREVKYDTCRFCMHQYLKVKHSEVASLSQFCPLDLYSCEPARVQRALRHLFETPQNNMRLFIRETADSSGKKPDDTVHMIDVQDEQQVEKLVRTLFPRLSTDEFSSSHSTLLQSFLASLLCTAPFRSLFRQLSHLQSTLDSLDIEGLHRKIEAAKLDTQARKEVLNEETLWRGLQDRTKEPDTVPVWMREILDSLPTLLPAHEAADNLNPAPSESSSPSPPSLFEFPSITTEGEANDIPHCAHCDVVCETNGKLPNPSSPSVSTTSSSFPSSLSSLSVDSVRNDLLSSIRRFLLATTLKDVSIMCTMQPAEKQTIYENGTENNRIAATRVHYSVRLIDLECKSVHKLPEYFRLDQEIVDTYIHECMKEK